MSGLGDDARLDGHSIESGWFDLARDVFRDDTRNIKPFHVLAVGTAMQFLPTKDRMALELRYGLYDKVWRDYNEVAALLPDRTEHEKTVPPSVDLADVKQVIDLVLLRLRHDLGQLAQ